MRLDAGQLDLAIADLRQALNDQPRATDLMVMLAIAYEKSGTVDLAEKEFADAMRVSNFDPTVSLGYVAFLQRRGSVSRAEDVLVDLASRWPKNVQVLSALAQVRLSRQEWVGLRKSPSYSAYWHQSTPWPMNSKAQHSRGKINSMKALSLSKTRTPPRQMPCNRCMRWCGPICARKSPIKPSASCNRC